MAIVFGSVCSGIEAAHAALAPLGWSCSYVAEIEPFPCHVLHQRVDAGRPRFMPDPDEPLPPGTKHAEKIRLRRHAAIRSVRSIPEQTGLVNVGDFTRLDPGEYELPDVLIGGTPCFPAGVLVPTRSGLTPIEQIIPGDIVLTHRGRWRRVSRIGSKVAETIVLRGQGCVLEATPDHPIYASRKNYQQTSGSGKVRPMSMGDPEWISAKNMTGRFWASPVHWPAARVPRMLTEGNEHQLPPMSAAFMRVIGRWLGDGWCRISVRRGYALICCAKKERETVAAELHDAGLRFNAMEQRTTIRFQISSRALARWLVENFGHGAAGKTIPTWAFGMNIALRKALFDGYVSADGYHNGDHIKISTVSRSLAVGAVLLIHTLGRAASCRFSKPSRKICVIEGREVSERGFYEITAYAQSRSSVVSGQHRWGRVRSIQPGKKTTVFNIEVEDDNSYVADGIVVHNCQGFSIAGLRGGQQDDRSNLAFQFVRLAHATDALRKERGLPGLSVLWENVPGVLSMPDNAFGCLLGGFVGADAPIAIRGSWPSAGMVVGPWARAAWRILDAQHFGLAQRRERVFLVVSFRDGPDPSAILFERHGMQGHSETRDEARKDIAGTLGGSSQSGGFRTTDLDNQGAFIAEVAPTISGNDGGADESDAAVGALIAKSYVQETANSLRAEGFDASEDGTGRQPALIAHTSFVPDIAWCLQERDAKGADSNTKTGHLLAFSSKDSGQDVQNDISPTLRAMNNANSAPNSGGQVAIAFNITPSNSNKDYNAREAKYAQTVLPGTKNIPSSRGGDVVVEPFAFESRFARNGRGAPDSVVPPLKAQSGETGKGDAAPLVAVPGTRWVVRRLTPIECERLQGFSDNYTAIEWRGHPPEECPDSPRFKALGNSFPVPVIRWIGRRFEQVISGQNK